MKIEIKKWALGVCFWYFPPKKPLFALLMFLVCPKLSEFLVQNLDFHPKRAFSLPPGKGCCTMSKKSPLLEPRECNARKTRHHSQIENALCLCRLFQGTLVSPLMSLGHYGSEHGILSPLHGHLAPPGHPSHAGLSRAGDIYLLTT